MSLITNTDRFSILGASGMAGSAISRSLFRKGYTQQFNPTRTQLDLSDSQSVNDWFLHIKPTVVVLAAAKVGGIYANSAFPADFLLQNIKIQTNVIESSWIHGVRRFLFLGSSCIYPKFAEQPIIEESLLNGSLEPTNESYAIAKIAGLKLCESLHKQYDFDAISLMPTNLYGPGDNYHPSNSHVLPALLRRFHDAKISKSRTVTCWGSGSPLREFLHCDDLGDAVTYCLEKWSLFNSDCPVDSKGHPLSFLNVGSGDEISIRDLAHKISSVVGYEGNIQWNHEMPDGTYRKKLDLTRIFELGWKATISLDEGLSETYSVAQALFD